MPAVQRLQIVVRAIGEFEKDLQEKLEEELQEEAVEAPEEAFLEDLVKQLDEEYSEVTEKIEGGPSDKKPDLLAPVEPPVENKPDVFVPAGQPPMHKNPHPFFKNKKRKPDAVNLLRNPKFKEYLDSRHKLPVEFSNDDVDDLSYTGRKRERNDKPDGKARAS